MKLYYLQGACSLAVHIVLEWIDQDYESQSVSRDELKSTKFLSLNPTGTVPVFQDGDLLLSQSTAILQYLAEKYPAANLLGSDLTARAETRRWLGLVNSDVHRVFGLFFAWPKYVGENCKEEFLQGAQKQLNEYLHILNQQLAGKDYLTGTRSIADAYLWVTLNWSFFLKLDISAYPELVRFHQHLSQDPGVQAALRQEGLA